MRRLVDYHEIQQTLCRFAIALDTREPALLDECFREDATISVAGAGTFSRAEFKTLSVEVLSHVDATQHFFGVPVTQVSGDVAVSRCYYIAQHARNALAPSPFLLIGGWSDDSWSRVGDGWRISRHVGTAAWYEGNPAVLNMPTPALPPGGLEWSPSRNCPDWLLQR